MNQGNKPAGQFFGTKPEEAWTCNRRSATCVPGAAGTPAGINHAIDSVHATQKDCNDSCTPMKAGGAMGAGLDYCAPNNDHGDSAANVRRCSQQPHTIFRQDN